MMETVLNVGLNDESVRGLAEQSHDERFAMDSYRRLLQMFGATVLGIESEVFSPGARPAEEGPRHRVRHRPRRRRPPRPGRDLQAGRSPSTPAAASRRTRASSSTWRCAPSSTRGTPSAPSSTAARSGSTRASVRRSTCRRWSSATAATTRAPASPSPATRRPGNQGVYGDYLQNAQGEDVVAGIRNTVSLADMEKIDKASHDELLDDHGHAREALPRHVRHRVHRRARQALDAPDPGRQAHARRRRSGSAGT